MATEPDRFVLGIAFKAGKHPGIKRGADGKRDYAENEVIEKAAWQYLREGREIGIEHIDGTVGHAEVVENTIWRAPDWAMKTVTGKDVTVSDGDWLIGMILDEPSWALRKSGKLNSLSAQGRVKRRKVGTEGALMKSEFVLTFKPAADDDQDDLNEITFLKANRVDMVGSGANAPDFLLAKSSTDDPSLITESEIHRLAKSAQEGDMTAKKTAPVADEELKKDALDPEQLLETPDVDAPGDPSDPGSPAFEAVDAARAGQAIELTVGLKRLVQQAIDREAQEALLGDDPTDGENVWNLQDVDSMIDCILGVLAPYQVAEQMEADGRESEDEGVLLKSGRVLSGTNEGNIRQAIGLLQTVVDTAAPIEPLMKSEPEEAAVTEENLAKADADDSGLQAVFDANGNLVGVVDPTAIQKVTGAGAPDADSDDTDSMDADAAPSDSSDASDDAAATDSTDEADAATAAAPEPPADPADGTTIPGTSTVQAPAEDDTEDVKKGQYNEFRSALAEVFEPLAKKLEVMPEFASTLEDLKKRVDEFGRTPDDRQSPRLNGAIFPGFIGRGETESGELTELRKAVETAPPEKKIEAQATLAYAAIKGRFAGQN